MGAFIHQFLNANATARFGKARFVICLLSLYALSGCCVYSGLVSSSTTILGGLSSFSYQCASNAVYVIGQSVSNSPTFASSATAGNFTISPSLPAGLSINSSTGTISGTPTAAVGATQYTISKGSQTASLNLRTASGFLVNDLTDAHNTGGSTCLTASSTCTLRAAVEAVNTIGSSRLILLPSGTAPLTLATALTLNAPMEIYGDCAQNTTVDGLSGTSLMTVQGGTTTLANIIFQNGSVASRGGAGLLITTSGTSFTTTLNNVTITNNVITSGSSGYENGAGILIAGQSAAIKATLVISNSSIVSNTNSASDGMGGGIAFKNYSVGTISNTSFSNNTSASEGGAIAVVDTNVSITVTASAIANNSATGGSGEGGGVFFNSGAGTATFTNVSFYANAGSQGGAIMTQGSSVNFTATNCTFVGNTSISSGSGGAIGGIGTVGSIQNSLFYNNKAAGTILSCNGSGGFTVTSLGYNLSDDAASDCNLNTGLHDVVSTAASLGAFQNNGGLTSTLALLVGSAGIGQASVSACPSTDQRGYSRNLPTSCDIGAYEY